jgi:hypothetical protein
MNKILCKHEKTIRGKDAPRQYGSYKTEVCINCNAFRFLDHHGNIESSWKDKSEYEQAIEPKEDM